MQDTGVHKKSVAPQLTDSAHACIRATLATARLTAEGSGISDIREASQQLVKSEQCIIKTQHAVDTLPKLVASLRGTQDLIVQHGSKLPALQAQTSQICQQLLLGTGSARRGSSSSSGSAAIPPPGRTHASSPGG